MCRKMCRKIWIAANLLTCNLANIPHWRQVETSARGKSLYPFFLPPPTRLFLKENRFWLCCAYTTLPHCMPYMVMKPECSCPPPPAHHSLQLTLHICLPPVGQILHNPPKPIRRGH